MSTVAVILLRAADDVRIRKRALLAHAEESFAEAIELGDLERRLRDMAQEVRDVAADEKEAQKWLGEGARVVLPKTTVRASKGRSRARQGML